MKLNIRAFIGLAAFAAVFAFTSASSAQMVGGYKAIAVTDAGAVAAADFAISAQSAKTEVEYQLEELVKAERQVVQGMNYRLCMEVSNGSDDSFYVQAVVYVDLKGNRKLTSWVNSTCGDTASAPVVKPIIVGGFSKVANNNAQAVAAAKFAAGEKSNQLETELTVAEILAAEMQVVQGMNYRVCMRVDVEGDEPITVRAVVYQDLKRKYTLSSWTEVACS